MRKHVICVAICMLGAVASLRAADLRDCAQQLRDVESDAGPAAEAADEAADAKEALDTARDDYRECRQYPDIYDLLHDGCSSQRDDYETARQTFNSAIEEYNSAARTFATALKLLQLACK